MLSKEDYLKFMSEVRKVSGVDTLTPDETGLVSIRVDDAYNVNLQFVEATGRVLCFVEVATLPSVRRLARRPQDFCMKRKKDVTFAPLVCSRNGRT